LGQCAKYQADSHRRRSERTRQQQHAGDDPEVVDGRCERREGESILGVQRRGEHTGEALEDDRKQRDAHQIDRQGALLVTRQTIADDRHERLGEHGQYRGQADECQSGQAENDADQSPQLAFVAGVLDEDRHKGRGVHRTDQQVVQD
jgi:hypothetical protein